jgi:WD40 repeat protein
MNNKNWKQLEEDAKEDEERAAAQALREKKKAQQQDVFEILGIKKTKEILEMENKKNEALESNRQFARDRLRAAGKRVMQSNMMVKRMGLLKRSVTVQPEPEPEKPKDPVSPKQLVARIKVSAQKAGCKLERRNTVDVAKDVPELRWKGWGAPCFALRFSPDDSQVAGTYMDGGIRIFDVHHNEHLHTLNVAHPREEPSSSSTEQSVFVDLPPMMPGPKDTPMLNLRWLPAGAMSNILATVDANGNVGFWNLPKRGGKASLIASVVGEHELNALSFSDDGRRLAVGGNEKIVKVFDITRLRGVDAADPKEEFSFGSNAGSVGSRILGHRLKIMSICHVPGNPDLLVSGGIDRLCLVWDLRARSSPVGTISGTELAGDAMDVSRTGTTVLVGSHRSENPLQLFDLRKLTQNADEHPGAYRKSSACELQALQTWQWDGESAEDKKSSPASLIFSAAWDQFNEIIVAAGEKESMARIFRKPAGGAEGPLTLISSLEGSQKAWSSAAISSDGRNAAFGGFDGTMIISSITST